jgi:hypothetical protein
VLNDAAVDVDASGGTCPLAGKSAATIDDGSWPAANAAILEQCGRTGAWYTFNDGDSKQSPSSAGPFGPFLTAGPPGGVTGYVRTFGTLSAAATGTASKPHWGAGFGFDLADAADGTARPYDLKSSGYQGFSFWLRTGTENQLPAILFQVVTSETVGFNDGAYHSFTSPSPAPGAWTKVTVPFTKLAQPAWTAPAERVAFDPAAVETLQWSFNSAPQQTLGFDVQIAGVELF